MGGKNYNYPLSNRIGRERSRYYFIEILGGCCRYCGYEDARALLIVRENGQSWYQGGGYIGSVKKAIETYKDEMIVVCRNCDAIRKYEANEPPFRIKKEGKDNDGH